MFSPPGCLSALRTVRARLYFRPQLFFFHGVKLIARVKTSVLPIQPRKLPQGEMEK
jgi:hypothetical protein